jgi:phage terminase Nu1 subunit (DNA packaging protein)
MAAPDCRKAGDLDRFCLTVTSSFCCPRAADCEAGEFTNFVGEKYQFKGKSSQSGSLARKSQSPLLAQS